MGKNKKSKKDKKKNQNQNPVVDRDKKDNKKGGKK